MSGRPQERRTAAERLNQPLGFFFNQNEQLMPWKLNCWLEIRPGWTVPQGSENFAVELYGEILAVAPSRGVTCKESRGVSGNALVWPDGAGFRVRDHVVSERMCEVRRSMCDVRNSAEFHYTQSGRPTGTQSAVARRTNRTGDFALAGADERRECLVFVPLVRCLV